MNIIVLVIFCISLFFTVNVVSSQKSKDTHIKLNVCFEVYEECLKNKVYDDCVDIYVKCVLEKLEETQ